MAKRLPFRRLERRVLTRTRHVRIDVPKLAQELAHERDVHERLRLAALRAIEDELAAIRAERDAEKG